jgi:hypothetical protein
MIDKFNIKDKELGQALEISLENIYEICDFFDSDPNDDWELKENEHFQWSNKSLGQRRFSPSGAFEICKYLETKEQNKIWKRFRRWLTRRDARLRSMLVVKKIVEIIDDVEFIDRSKSVIIQNDRAYLRPRYTRELLGLGRRQDILNRAFEAEQKEVNREPLQIDKHFIIHEDQVCFAGAGIARIGENLGTTLTQKHRREWCILVAEKTPFALKKVFEDYHDWEKKIKKAMDKAKKDANRQCQITWEKITPANPFNLAVHHVFDKNNYPHLATEPNNLIVMNDNLHKDFHIWMGGTKVSCTVEDLEKYIETFSTSLFPDDDGEKMTKTLMRIKRIKNRVNPLI